MGSGGTGAAAATSGRQARPSVARHACRAARRVVGVGHRGAVARTSREVSPVPDLPSEVPAVGAERETGRGAAAVGAADAMQLGQLAEAVSGSAITMDGDAVQVEWLAADVPAVETGTPHADAHPLDDEV